MAIRPTRFDVPEEEIVAIRQRVFDYPWHEMPRGEDLEGTWAYGANLDYMKQLCSYWGKNTIGKRNRRH